MKKIVTFVGLLLISALPFVASAMVTCRDTTKGCTLEQNLDLISKASIISKEELLDVLKETVQQLVAKMAALNAPQTSPTITPIGDCLTLTRDLILGSTDASTNGEVSKIQRFLNSASVYPEANFSGYYGTLTAQAVVRWQKAHGMDFVTLKSGVGPMTRGKMACAQTVTQCPAYDSKPVISSISPSSGPVGTTIEIQGCNFSGFEGDKTVWFTDSKGVKGVWNGQTDAETRTSNTVLRVTLPAKICSQMNWYSGFECTSYLNITPGVYSIYTNSFGGRRRPACPGRRCGTSRW